MVKANTPASGFSIVNDVRRDRAPPWLKPPIIIRSGGILYWVSSMEMSSLTHFTALYSPLSSSVRFGTSKE